MKGYAVTVDFRLKPGTLNDFRTLIDRNAVESCRDEPGCRRFDVLVPKGEDARIYLYEIYDSRAAFEDHLRTPHFLEFNRQSAGLVESKAVAEFDLVREGTEG
jgi:(4S)-4-hydroxy-5-phosphonooxypentane-2,3-dione isomerase